MGDEGNGVEELAQRADRVVLGAHPPLLHDDLPLGVDLRGIEEQVAHPVGFELEHEVQLVGGESHVIDGDVTAREGVVLAADGLDELREDPGTVRRRPLEHHVLEVVGEPGGPYPLVAGTDAVPHLEARDRAPVVLLEEDAQAVVERGVDDLLRPGPRARKKEQGRAEEASKARAWVHGASIQWRCDRPRPNAAPDVARLDPRRSRMLASSKRSGNPT
jgi:hypothetical protein